MIQILFQYYQHITMKKHNVSYQIWNICGKDYIYSIFYTNSIKIHQTLTLLYTLSNL